MHKRGLGQCLPGKCCISVLLISFLLQFQSIEQEFHKLCKLLASRSRRNRKWVKYVATLAHEGYKSVYRYKILLRKYGLTLEDWNVLFAHACKRSAVIKCDIDYCDS